MSGISYSHDVDLELHNQNPNSTNSQEVEELPPFPQTFPSPIFYENQLFFDTMAAEYTQRTNLEPIWNEPLPRVNMNTAHWISTNSSTGGIHLHSEPSDHSSKMKKSTTSSKGSTARKSGKKDRHSKINTAQGVRDRRMRLSLQIARQFFDLQDALGFDKASKTIDWLFSASKKAIKQLDCSSSLVSEMNNNNTYQKSEQKRKVDVATSEGEDIIGLKTAEKPVASGNTKSTAKELRNKARERARERTREKLMIRSLEKSNSNICGESYNLAQLGPAEYPNFTGQELMSNPRSQDTTWTSQSSLHSQLANMALLGATASSSGSVSSSMFNYDEKKDLFTGTGLDSISNNLCYTGNWDFSSEYLNPNSISFQENRGYHFQYYSDQNQAE
ncbi:hypothetical protein DCAR_0727177 [Daucus carota subsp. sativus]|uniref:TCP domain-containing protein n=2 Tax=Daucus carota subsp. sativus TaxID=79200 RepID=A0AAF1B5W3_DAUCS|nr:PREDICTED: transcription factor TCP12-like [Daucus carota subsp. sativus]WOH07744.1 hypothetical protein DCAR_0727177 [Daucus carota subsp. sativus]